MKKLTSILVLFAFVFCANAQESKRDSTLKNTVRINVTPLLITGKSGSLSMGYERVLFGRQTISANVGHLQLPTIITTKQGSPVEWISNLRNTGLICAVDYRFYFKRNKYAAPDGLYWGPYMTYYYIDNKARIELIDNNIAQGTADIQTYLNMTTFGLQLGYQFVLGKRWTIDVVTAGPGVGFYKLQMAIDANGSIEGNEDYLQGVYDALVSLFPGAAQLFEEQKVDVSGKKSFSGLGFRALVQVGFRF